MVLFCAVMGGTAVLACQSSQAACAEGYGPRRAVGIVQEPQPSSSSPDGRKKVPDVGAAVLRGAGRGAAPLAFIGAGAQAQAGVIKVLRAAVFAFGEQAGGGLEAAVAQQDGFRRVCACHWRSFVSRLIVMFDLFVFSCLMIVVMLLDFGLLLGVVMVDVIVLWIVVCLVRIVLLISLRCFGVCLLGIVGSGGCLCYFFNGLGHCAGRWLVHAWVPPSPARALACQSCQAACRDG